MRKSSILAIALNSRVEMDAASIIQAQIRKRCVHALEIQRHLVRHLRELGATCRIT